MSFLINLVKEETPQHNHKNYEIIICTKGEGVLQLTQKNIKVDVGKFVIVPPGITHRGLKSDSVYERIYINGDFEHVFNITSPIVVNDNPAKEGLCLAKIIYNNRHSDSVYLLSLVNALTYFLIQNFNRKHELFTAVESIVNEIGSSFYNCNINLNAMLKKSGYAEDYIRAKFKEITGKTPTEFLNESRIKHACYLIDIYKSSISLSDIAEKCGYLDYVYFSKKFKQIIGISPHKYSEKNLLLELST